MQDVYVLIETDVENDVLIIHRIGQRDSLLVRGNLLQIAFSGSPINNVFNVYKLSVLGVSEQELVNASQNTLKRLVEDYKGVLETL